MYNLTYYRLRAECQFDIGRMLAVVHTESLTLQQNSFINDLNGLKAYIPDVTVSFASSLTLAEIKQALREIEDGHVMAQTVALAADYTGERDVSDD